MNTEFSYENWPQKLREIAEASTPETALSLAAEYGGVPVYIPKHPDETSKLISTVGLHALRQLAVMYGGDWLTVPRGVALGEGKKAIVLALLRDGLSLRQTAIRAKVSLRYVARLAALVREDQQQMPLPLGVDIEPVQNV